MSKALWQHTAGNTYFGTAGEPHLRAKNHLNGACKEAPREICEQLGPHLNGAGHVHERLQLRPGCLELPLHLLHELPCIRYPATASLDMPHGFQSMFSLQDIHPLRNVQPQLGCLCIKRDSPSNAVKRRGHCTAHRLGTEHKPVTSINTSSLRDSIA